MARVHQRRVEYPFSLLCEHVSHVAIYLRQMVRAVVVVVEGAVAIVAEGAVVLLTDIAEQERRLCFDS